MCLLCLMKTEQASGHHLQARKRAFTLTRASTLIWDFPAPRAVRIHVCGILLWQAELIREGPEPC